MTSRHDETGDEINEQISKIDEGYEYLMAYASHAEETGDDVAKEYITEIRESLRTIKAEFVAYARKDEELTAYFEWITTETELAIESLTLFLEHAEMSPDTVNALLSVPPLRNSLTTILYLEEIGVL